MREASIFSAMSALQPKMPQGTPPAIGLPTTKKSGSRFHSLVQPPMSVEMVWVSSMISRLPYLRVSSRHFCMKPGSGRTMPMLVIAGSQSRAQTSPWASAASSASTSLNGMERLYWVRS
ncbi:hypothetical protein D3C80_1535280 [compost metagenome]